MIDLDNFLKKMLDFLRIEWLHVMEKFLTGDNDGGMYGLNINKLDDSQWSNVEWIARCWKLRGIQKFHCVCPNTVVFSQFPQNITQNLSLARSSQVNILQQIFNLKICHTQLFGVRFCLIKGYRNDFKCRKNTFKFGN